MSKTTIPDLSSAVQGLSLKIETAMASLYSLHTALINARGNDSDNLRSALSKIKEPIKRDWDATVAFLQKCHAFGGDVDTLNDSLGKESAEDCMEFLIEMAEMANVLLQTSKSLLKNSERHSKTLSEFAPAFIDRLQMPVITRPEDGFQPSQEYGGSPGYFRGYFTDLSPPEQHLVVPKPTAADKETRAFIDTNLSAIYPNGKEALLAAQDALVGISSTFETIRQFWKATSQACQSYISTRAPTRGPIISENEAKQFAKSWEGYQEALKDAISSIARSSDAILINAVGAPIPRQPTPPPPPVLTYPYTSSLNQHHGNRVTMIPYQEYRPQPGGSSSATPPPLPPKQTPTSSAPPPLPPRPRTNSVGNSFGCGINVWFGKA